jgi:hypothetical protein
MRADYEGKEQRTCDIAWRKHETSKSISCSLSWTNEEGALAKRCAEATTETLSVSADRYHKDTQGEREGAIVVKGACAAFVRPSFTHSLTVPFCFISTRFSPQQTGEKISRDLVQRIWFILNERV